jgi:hypothetical protein
MIVWSAVVTRDLFQGLSVEWRKEGVEREKKVREEVKRREGKGGEDKREGERRDKKRRKKKRINMQFHITQTLPS